MGHCMQLEGGYSLGLEEAKKDTWIFYKILDPIL